MQITFYPHPPAHLLHSIIQSLPFHFATCVRYVPLSFLPFIRSSGEPPDSRSISISVTSFHSGYTNFVSQAALTHITNPVLRLMLPLLNQKPFVRFISFLLYPCFLALLFCLPTMLCFIYCGYA